MGYLKSFGTAVVYISLFLAIITFVPGFPPETEFQEYSVSPFRDLDPKVGPKNRLYGAEKLYEGEIKGPESFDSYDGKLYTGLDDGYVVRIEENRVVPIVKLGKKCDGTWQEQKCGKILGLKFDKKGNLYVIDTYYGIFKVDIATAQYEKIVDISKPIDGKIPLAPNSLDVAENGDIYWTDMSTDYYIYDALYAMLSNPSGRLIRYDAIKKKNEVLIRDLACANGVKLSEDESFIIIAELTRSRILKYNLKGPKAGQQEIFTEGLLGVPDNLHSDGHGGFLAALLIYGDSQNPMLLYSLAPHPYIRKMFIRLSALIEAPFKLLQDIYPNTYTEWIIHVMGHSSYIATLADKMQRSLILRIDASGKILEAICSNDGTIYSISSAYIHDNYLWLGSPWHEYINRIPLKQAFPDLADSKQSLDTNEKQLPKIATSDQIKLEKSKQNAESTTTKPIVSKKATSTRPTNAPTMSKSTPVSTTTSKPTAIPAAELKSTVAPTMAKPTAMPTTTSKSSSVPNSDKPNTVSNTKSEAKSSSKPVNAQVEKETVKKIS